MIATAPQNTPPVKGTACCACGSVRLSGHLGGGQAHSPAPENGHPTCHAPARRDIPPATAASAPSDPSGPDAAESDGDTRVWFPAEWAERINDSEHRIWATLNKVTCFTHRSDGSFGPVATAKEASLLFDAAIELAVRAGSLSHHIASKLGEPCDPRIAAFLSTRQTTNTTPDSESGPPVTPGTPGLVS